MSEREHPMGMQQEQVATLDHARAMNALRELDAASKYLSAMEVAQRTRAILDRSGMATLTVDGFLAEKGYTGPALYRAVATFGRVVAAAYRRERGMEPLRVERFVEHLGQSRRVCEYLEADRPLIEAAYVRWTSEGDL